MNLVWNMRNALRAAGVIVFGVAATGAWAAAPLEIEPQRPATNVAAPVTPDYSLDTEMVVHHWILCVSQTVAEELAEARAVSPEKARATYSALEKARTCGRFPELRVILRERVHVSAPGSDQDARVFKALVNLEDQWGSAFVVSGGLPDE